MSSSARQQLNIRLDADLQARLAAAADQAGLPPSTLVRNWIVERLAASSSIAAPEAVVSSERLAAIEARLAALEVSTTTKPSRRPPPPPKQLDLGAGDSAPVAVADPGDGRASAPAPAPLVGAAPGQLTTAELAARLGVKRGSFNERVRRMGGARPGLEMEGWKCVGQAPGPNGGPARWVWEQS